MELFNFNNVLAVVQKTTSASENLSIIIGIMIVIIVILIVSTVFSDKK